MNRKTHFGGRGFGPRLAGVIAATTLLFAAAAAEAQSPTPVKIRVAGQDAQISGTPMFAAMRQGYFKDAGLDVTFVVIGGGATPMAAALKAGEVDVGLGGASQYLEFVARGIVPGKVIGELMDNLNVILGGNGITDVKQLKGKIFGVSAINAGDHVYSQAVLAYYGIKADEVTWLAVGVPASRLSALTTGRIDAMEALISSLPEAALTRTILSPENSPVPSISSGIFARQGFIDANRPALQRFLAAMGKGADWVRAHPAEALPACQDSGTAADLCKSAIAVAVAYKNAYTWSSTSRLNIEAVKANIATLAVDIPQVKNMKLEDFADLSLAGGP